MSSTASKEDDDVVAFIGLGNMGSYMALNLARYLQEKGKPALRVWNRTESKCQDLIDQSEGKDSMVAVKNLEEVAETCQIIITSLANDEVVKQVYHTLLSSVTRRKKGKGVVFVETSTVYPTVTDELEKQISAIEGCSLIASPPFGPPPMAKSASLVFVVAGGTAEARKRVEPLLVPSMARKIMDFGHQASKAVTFKLIGNSMILSTVEMLSETMTLADKTGLGSDRVLEWIKDFYPAPSAIGYGTKIATNDFKASGGFTCIGGKKDATHIKNLGDSVGCPMHIVERAIAHLDASIEANKSDHDKDWSSLVAGQRIESNLPPFGPLEEQ